MRAVAYMTMGSDDVEILRPSTYKRPRLKCLGVSTHLAMISAQIVLKQPVVTVLPSTSCDRKVKQRRVCMSHELLYLHDIERSKQTKVKQGARASPCSRIQDDLLLQQYIKCLCCIINHKWIARAKM